MDDVRHEFLDIVAQIRTHLELQRALGVRVVESRLSELKPQQNHIKENPPPPRFTKAPIKECPPMPKTAAAPSTVSQSPALEAVREKLRDCTRCKLSKNRKNIVFGEGNPEAGLVFIGEGPGQEEDEQARPFVGAAGQLLTDIIVKGMRLKREEDVYICNIVKCRPPDNRNPEPDEIAACEPFLLEQILAIKPKIIIGLGNVAVKTLVKTTQGITALRGKWQSYQGIRLMPTFHPAYLLRNPSDKKLVWEDIKKVLAEMEKLKTS